MVLRLRNAISSHPAIAVLLGSAVVALVVFVLVFFQPQKLFIDEKVNEALPGTAAAAMRETAMRMRRGARTAHPTRPRMLGGGPFQSFEHQTSGRARVLDLGGDRLEVQLGLGGQLRHVPQHVAQLLRQRGAPLVREHAAVVADHLLDLLGDLARLAAQAEGRVDEVRARVGIHGGLA